MLKSLKIIVVVLLVVVSAIVQLAVHACAFRVTGNLEWYPVQLAAFAFDGVFILLVWRFLRRQPSFPAAVLFVFVGDMVLFFLALLARQAPSRFPDWFSRSQTPVWECSSPGNCVPVLRVSKGTEFHKGQTFPNWSLGTRVTPLHDDPRT